MAADDGKRNAAPEEDRATRPAEPPDGSAPDGAVDGAVLQRQALSRRMVGAAVGNLLCAGWHVYLGLSLLARLSSRRKAWGTAFLTFAGFQVAAGVAMLLLPQAWLFVLDAGIYMCCAIVNIAAAQTGAVAGWVQYLGYFQVLMAIDCWRRFRLFQAPSSASDSPLVTAPATPAGAEAAQPESSAAGAPDAAVGQGKVAGRVQDGRFVISTEEQQAAIADPDAYDNVVKTATAGVTGPETWYLVLGPGAAILFDAGQEHVWTVRPEDLKLAGRFRALTIASGEGKKSRAAFAGLDVYPILAWKSASWEEFESTARGLRKGSPWDLLCWSLTNGRRLAPWLPWPLPHGSRQGWIQALCADEEALGEAIRRWQVRHARKWAGHAPLAEADALRAKVASVAEQQKRSALVAGVAMLVVGASLAALTLGTSPGSADAFVRSFKHVIGLTAGIVLVAGGAIALGWRLFLGCIIPKAADGVHDDVRGA